MEETTAQYNARKVLEAALVAWRATLQMTAENREMRKAAACLREELAEYDRVSTDESEEE